MQAVRFVSRAAGYDASQVGDLLHRIAVELDAGRPAGPLIENATFQLGRPGFDDEAVDWFLDQLHCREDASQSAGMSADPWRDLPVGNHFTRSVPGDPAEHLVAPSRQARRKQESARRKQETHDLAQECADAWHDFGQQPGTHLQWVRAGPTRRELRTAEQQTIASRRWSRSITVGTGGRTFTWTRVSGSSLPGIAETVSRSQWEGQLLFLAADMPDDRELAKVTVWMRKIYSDLGRLSQLLDKAGTPVLYTSGRNFNHHAGALITFPDQRWLRFPVRGTDRSNAIMTAVDQAGNKVARYRIIRKAPKRETEITVHPGQQLTDELVLAIAISAPWLSSYFDSPAQ